MDWRPHSYWPRPFLGLECGPPASQIRPKYFGPRFGRVRTNGAALKINYVGPFTKTDPWLPLNCPLCNRANRRAGFWINSKSFYVDHEYGGFFTTVQDQSKLQNQAILLVQRKLFEPKLNYTRVRVQHVKEKIVEFVELFVKWSIWNYAVGPKLWVFEN